MFLEIFRSFKVFGLILWLLYGPNFGKNRQNSNNWTKIAPFLALKSFMAIFAFFRKSDKIGKIVLKFAKMDPSQKKFKFENLFYFGPLVKI